MRRFLLLDHYLCGLGGHNFQYAYDVLQAAEARGFAPWAAVQDGCPTAGWPSSWNILPIFPDQGNYRLALSADGRARTPLDLHGHPLPRHPGRCSWRERLVRHMTHRWETLRLGDRAARIARFAAAGQRLLQTLPLQDGDVGFFPSLSDFDLLGVLRFLRDTPATQAIPWHLQFHFDILEGRPHEYAAQVPRLELIRRQFRQALDQVPDHRLHFYSTTQAVAAEYNRLEVVPFEWLPYPVNAKFEPATRPARSRLRVTCAGGLRREKGKHLLTPLLQSLASELRQPGPLQLVVQAPASRLKKLLPRDWHHERTHWACAGDEPLISAPHPLSGDAYVELVRDADVGLFLYDSRRYFARCSGVLVEMLAAGVPVLVPAGCWLSEQIARPNANYVAGLWQDAGLFGRRGVELVTAPPRGRGRGATTPPAQVSPPLPVEETAADALLRIQVPGSCQGRFLRLTVRCQTACPDQPPRELVRILRADAEGEAHALIPLASGTAAVQFFLQDAYATRPLPLHEVAWGCLPETGSTRHRHRPQAAVGLAYAGPDDVATCLRELLRHHAHYQAHARQFSQSWRRQHAATRTVDLLEQSTREFSNPAAVVLTLPYTPAANKAASSFRLPDVA